MLIPNIFVYIPLIDINIIINIDVNNINAYGIFWNYYYGYKFVIYIGITINIYGMGYIRRIGNGIFDDIGLMLVIGMIRGR